jgi:hypothetical protein
MSTPIVSPDVAEIDPAIATVVTKVAPFIPAKVRATIYTISGIVGVIAAATAPVVGGTVGVVLDVIGGAATVLASSVALSHVSGK